MNPQVPKKEVPSYDIVEEKIKELDGIVIIIRVFYMIDNAVYNFQLLRNDRMCTVEIPRKLLEDLKDGDPSTEEELINILKPCFKDSRS